MKKAEKILGGLTLIFMICRLLFIYPYSAILITISSLFLSLIYLLFGFALFNNIKFRDILKKESYKSISILRILLTIITGFILFFLVIYSLFKFQMWPYGELGLLFSLRLLSMLLVVTVIKFLISKNKFYLNFIMRLLTIGVYSMLLFFISNENLLEMKYKNFPDYIEVEKELMQDPENKYLQQKARKERQKMHLSEN